MGSVVSCSSSELVAFHSGVGILGEEAEDRGSGKMNPSGVLSLEAVRFCSSL